jgi:VacB/RNase II family 3'-5' exoribonuclease
LQVIRSASLPSGLRDLRHLLWSSIDNDESRDLDQIEYVEPAGKCIRLFIGIADVTSYLTRGGAIDRRAAQNTVTLYTPNRTFHLLPEALSTDKTSLRENEDRSAVVIEMLVEADGQVHDAAIYRALVRNKAKLSYEKVAHACEDRSPDDTVCTKPGLREQLDLQLKTADRLDGLRKKMGALTFSSYEAQPVTRNGQLVDLALVSRNRTRDMIEGFMIAANVACATFLKARGWPIIERVVDAPRNWERIRQIAAGFDFGLPETPAPKPLSEFLASRRAADSAAYRDLSLSIVKLLGPGVYRVETPTGPQSSHFGLAVDDYSHTTAPNRRYADQVLQRMLLACTADQPNPFTDGELDQVARHCSEREDAARKVERTLRKVAAAFLLQDRIGEVFPGIVTGSSSKGTYVRVKHPAAEGRVIHGERGLLVGDRPHVRLLSVDPEHGFIDFERT